MKIFKKIAVVLILAILCLGVVACIKKPDPGPGPGNKVLTPADISKLAPLTNYRMESKYYSPNAVTYADYSAEKTKLENRIESKKADALLPDTSSVIKIFAASDAEQIILAMGEAALPTAKMTKTVDYLAGEEAVSEDAIDDKVASGTWSLTPNWSFFDDWSYYEKLQDRADTNTSTDTDKDNVKRQYRNIAGKIFSIGMSGDEFGRVATYELKYALTVVAKMAGNNPIGSGQFDNYCKNYLDYDTLVYLKAFDKYYDGGAGLPACVALYGYYYDYNHTNYNAVSDADFEKELIYSHYTTYTDAEWLEYVAIQRNNYINAYRYTDAFYSDLYSKHFSFQQKKEDFEYEVYDFAVYNSLKYTQEMHNAILGNGLQGQLNMSDWMWCYSGKEDVMKSYNQANTKYENGKKGSSEAENEGKFYYDIEQLKMVNYLLTNMTGLNLSGALRYQIYSYSGSMVQSISNNEKDVSLINANKKVPSDVTSVIEPLVGEDAKDYAKGKVRAIITQMKASYEIVGVNGKITKSANESWSSMQKEINDALIYDYTSLSSWEDKVKRLEDLVIKKKYDCGVGLDDICPLGNGHAECVEVYDTEHTISQFVSNYEQILKHVGGKVALSFQQHKKATTDKKNNYTTSDWSDVLPKTYTCGYNSTSPVTTDMLKGIVYYEEKEITIGSGKVFKDDVLNADKEQREWWASASSSPIKESSTVSERNESQQSATFTYVYTFSGWYLDQNLVYKFDPNDKINCDLILYVGYNVTKRT